MSSYGLWPGDEKPVSVGSTDTDMVTLEYTEKPPPEYKPETVSCLDRHHNPTQVYDLAEQTRTQEKRDQLTYRYMTGDTGPSPPEWVHTRDKTLYNCINQHYQNNLLEAELNVLHYDKQQALMKGTWGREEKLLAMEEKLAVGQARAKEMSGLAGGILNTVVDLSQGLKRKTLSLFDFPGITRPWNEDPYYSRFIAGAELRKHPDYGQTEAIIHGLITKAGEDALWLAPAARLGKIGKLVNKRPLVTKLVRGLKEAVKWETILAGPEIVHRAVDEALEADEDYYEGSKYQLEATVRRDGYVDILKDNLLYAGIGFITGAMAKGGIPKDLTVSVKAPKGLVARRAQRAVFDKKFTIERLVKAVDKDMGVVKPLTVLKKPGVAKKVIHATKAWFPTYSAFVEKRFGKYGQRLLYTHVYRGTGAAESFAAKELDDVIRGLKPGWFNKMIKIPLKEKGRFIKVTRGQKLDMVMSNACNKAEKFTYENKVVPFDDIANKLFLLDKTEIAFMKKAIHLFKRSGNRLAQKHAEQGKPFTKVKNYYPIRRSGYTYKEPLTLTDKGWKREGFRKERVKSDLPFIVRPIQDVIRQSTDQTAKYIYLAEPTERAMNVITKLPQLNRTEVDMLLHQLRHNYGVRPIETGVEKLLRGIMRNITVGVLGLNPTVAAKQVCSGPLALVYVKPKYWFGGMLDYVTHPREVKTFFKANSFWINKRITGGMNKEMQELAVKSGSGKVMAIVEKAREKTMLPIKFMDEQTVLPIMNGAYRQAFDEIVAGKLSSQVRKVIGRIDKSQSTTVQAIQFAEAVVAKTQPMFDSLNRSRLANSRAMGRSFTMFSSATNQMASLLVRTFKKGSKAEFATALATVGLNVMGVVAIGYGSKEFYHSKYRASKKGVTAEELAGEGALTAAGLAYFARDIAGWIKFYRYGAHPENPLTGWSNDMLDASYQIYNTWGQGKKMSDYQLKQLVLAVTHGFGVPTLVTEAGLEIGDIDTKVGRAIERK